MNEYRQLWSGGGPALLRMRADILRGQFSLQRWYLWEMLRVIFVYYLRQNGYYYYMCLCCR